MAQVKSLELDGADQSVSITDGVQTNLDLAGDMTIEFWVKFHTLTTTKVYPVGKWDTGQRSYAIGIATNKIRFDLSDNGSVNGQDYSAVFTTETWYHIAIAYDASEGIAEVYIDGSHDGQITGLVNSIYNGTAPLDIGHGEQNDASWVHGHIDEVRIWNDIRTAQEIADNYKVQINSTAGLIASWQFEDALGDESGSGNTLTNNNSATFSTDIPSWVTDYPISVTIGTFTLTGIAVGLLRGIQLVASVGTFVLTGIANTFNLGFAIIASVGNFALTGVSVVFTRTLIMIASVGSFALTGVTVTFKVVRMIIASVGNFILTGINVILRLEWRKEGKETTSFTKGGKPTTSFTKEGKSAGSWEKQPK